VNFHMENQSVFSSKWFGTQIALRSKIRIRKKSSWIPNTGKGVHNERHGVVKKRFFKTLIKRFSPVWTFIWRISLSLWANDLVHRLHSLGFSPVCILIWIWRKDFVENSLEHWLQLYWFSPVWTFIWRISWFFRANDLVHRLHWKVRYGSD